ncbi:MAG TPA: DCC1-like thiol-disulfide oxidoreductase family protein, partial [Acidimicrobiia bacterium]
PVNPAPTPARLTVVYDEHCELCRRCRHWLEWQPRFVEMEFLAAGSPAARQRYGGMPWLGAELVVADDQGRVWIGPAAFLICLWATREWRAWSYRLSGPMFAPLAERFFHLVSVKRGRLVRLLRPSSCEDGRCRHHQGARV